MASPSIVWTVADLLQQFDPISAARIRHDPPPGTATEKDVIEIEARENRLYELVDRVLVEKVMWYYESYLAILIARFVGNFVEEHNLGIVAGADGMIKLAPDLVRIPDVSFFSWGRLPGGNVPQQAIPDLAPDLAVEVISEGNTPEEMERKLREYFDAGVRLVWYVYPTTRSVKVYRSTDNMSELTGDQMIEGGDELPGFQLAVSQFFAPANKRHEPS